MSPGADRDAVIGNLRFQAEACRMLGSPAYGAVLDAATADAERGGVVWRLLRGQEGDPAATALGLRMMGALNRLALAGRERRLAAILAGDSPAEWEPVAEAMERNEAELRGSIGRPVQTNEVGRCAALLLGFGAVAGATGLPLRLLEVGASAGLNLRWDSYRYAADGFAWGPADSPLTLEFALTGAAPELPAEVEVRERRGCDPDPIEPGSEAGRTTLLAYVWPDQRERVERLRAALAIAERLPLAVERARAVAWLGERLAEPCEGVATVVFHSIVAQYLGDELAQLEALLDKAGSRAGAGAPLAWLRLEPDGEMAALDLTLWPGGETRRLARAGYHGSPLATR